MSIKLQITALSGPSAQNKALSTLQDFIAHSTFILIRIVPFWSCSSVPPLMGLRRSVRASLHHLCTARSPNPLVETSKSTFTSFPFERSVVAIRCVSSINALSRVDLVTSSASIILNSSSVKLGCNDLQRREYDITKIRQRWSVLSCSPTLMLCIDFSSTVPKPRPSVSQPGIMYMIHVPSRE